MTEEIKVFVRYVRISPQKIRRIIGAIKGKPVENALNMLRLMPQKSARILFKGISSAVANAEKVQNINIDYLVVHNVTADQGPVLKRFRARARGRGTRILKRTAHVTIVLTKG